MSIVMQDKKTVLVEGSYTHELKIPTTWEFAQFSDVIEIIGGSQPPKSDFMEEPIGDCVRLIQIRDYKSDKNIVYIPRDKAKRFVSKDEVMIGRYGPPIFQILRGLEGAYNVALMKAKPRDGIFSNEYLYRYLSNKELYNYVESASDRTAGQSGVNKKHLEQYPVSVPPLAEQQRIVEKLDEVLTQVDTIKARLDGIPAIIKRFRQSVLAAAVSGKLTEEMSTQQWGILPLSGIAANIVDCPHSTPKWSEESTGKYCVRTTGFNPFKLDMTNQGFVSEEVYQDRIKRLEPQAGDILYSREGTVGIACQIPKGVTLCLGQRMVLIRSGEKVLSNYLEVVLNSDHILRIVKSLTIGSTAPRVNMKDIKNYPIPVPSFSEQKEIVRLVDQYFAFADTIEAQVKKAQVRVDNLTQSILAKAFRGELVPQDPEDEPADKLLQRIAEARKEAEALAKAAKKAEAAKKRAAKVASRV